MTTGVAELRELDDNQLSELWRAGQIDLATLERESERRDKADARRARAAAKLAAEKAAWYDAAYAQYLAAADYCQGNLYSRLALEEMEQRAAFAGEPLPESDGMALWRESDQWAERRASPELINFWQDNGGRLSLAAYRAQQAMQRRADRDARDLAAMPEPRPAPTPREVLQRAAPRQARPAGSIARYITALGVLRREANATRRDLQRLNGAIAR